MPHNLPPTPLSVPINRWDAQSASQMSEAELLVYRSNLLGRDLSVTNYGGGNTSAKLLEVDPLTGEETNVLWVKGSGGDLGSIAADGFATLYLSRLRGLENLYEELDHEDRMVDYLPHCTFGVNMRAASIDTPLHAFVEARHIDHVHPDAVIAIAATSDSEHLTAEIFGNEIGWLPWQRPGFDLGLRLRDLAAKYPKIKGVVLEGHGLFSWASTSHECYQLTIDLVAKAATYINDRMAAARPFGDVVMPVVPDDEAANYLTALLPRLRGKFSAHGTKLVAHVDRSAETLEFVTSGRLQELAALGTSCPDHFLRTKIKPMVLGKGDDINAALTAYRQDYSGYYERNKGAESPEMRGADPVVVLLPGVGLVSFAANKTTARIASEFYRNAINVMRGAETLGHYVALPEREAFRIEYWALEEAKLQRMPRPKPLAGKVALITGGAGGIGFASAHRLAEDGACVVVADINEDALEERYAELCNAYGSDCIARCYIDVTDEDSVAAAFGHAVRTFGGIDIVIANAGVASAGAIEDTSVAVWRNNQSVLAEGYFLTARAAFPILREVGGGSIIFVGSKNALVASKGAAAYASAKAAALHLARNLALEGAEHGIRVNTVNPDAVLEGSAIWSSTWRKERAAAYGLKENDLEAHYRDRSLLKRSVFPADIAEAVAFFASDVSAKSTGNIINVDAGHAGAFTR